MTIVVQVLDSNGSGGLTSQEFCAAMKKLVRFGCGRCGAGGLDKLPKLPEVSLPEIKAIILFFTWSVVD